MANPVDIAAELNKLILQQNQNLLNQAKIQRNQLTMMQKMVDMLQEINPSSLSQGYKDLGESIADVDAQLDQLGGSSQEAMARHAEATARAKTASEGFADSLKKTAKASKLAIAAATGLATLGKTWAGIKNIGSGLFDVVSQIGSLIINIGASIIAAPFKMLGGLMEAASQGGGSELRQALEDIRKQFGDLATGSSKAIITMSKSMKGELANTGLSTYRIFGNLAERLNAIAEYAKQLGPLFTNLSGDLMKNAETFGAYAKGLGLTEEGMRGVGMLALTTGKSFGEVGREITSFAFQMGDAFGINGKEISRDVATMMKDVKNFGNLSVKQLTQVTVYARKLGLEFKDMQGVIDKFDNFEDAAAGAAQLSQAFGLNIDALELVQEQDPAARFDKLRKAFYATGRSVEQMTRQELKLLAAQTGLSEEAVKLGFAQQNQGVGYDEVQKKAGLAEKKQLTQAEAMEKLAGSIERLVKSGGGGASSFFEAFANGFQTGIVRSKDFREMMIAIKRSMREVFLAGRQIGQIFVEIFPGIKDVFGGIKDLFNPSRIRNLMQGVIGAFRKFFTDLKEGKGTALPDLMNTLKEKFFNFFSTSEGAGKKILDGVKSFAKAFVPIISGLVKMAMEGLSSAFRSLADFIRNPDEFLAAASGAGSGIMSSVLEALAPIWDAIKESWPELQAAFMDLLGVAVEKIKPQLPMILSAIGAALFGPAALSGLSALGTVAGTKLAGVLVEGLLKKITSPSTGGGISGAISGLMNRATGAQAAGAGGAASSAEVIAEQGRGMEGVKKSLTEVAKGNLKSAMKNAAINIGMITTAAIAMAVAYTAIDKILPDNITIGRVGEIAGVLGVMMLAYGGIGLGMAALSKVNISGQVANLATGFVAISLGVMGMVGVFNLVNLSLASVKAEDAKKVDTVLKSMMFAFAATGLILVEAAAVGAGVIAGAGIGAVAAIVGFTAITAGIMGMAETAKKVIGVINSVNLSPGFERKATVFTQVFQGVMGIANSMANILKAVQPSFLSSVFGKAEPISKSLESAKNLIDGIASQSTEIVRTITQSLKDLTPEQLDKASKFSGIIGAMSNLLKSLTASIPSVEVGFTESTAATMNSIMESASTIFQINANLLKTTIAPSIQSLLDGIVGMPEISQEKIGVVSAVFSGMGTMLSSIGSAGAFIGNVLQQVKSEGGTIDTSLLNTITDSATRIISSTTQSITRIAPAFGEAVRVIDAAFSGMSDKQFKRVEFGFKQLGMILYYSSKFTDVLKGDAINILNNANNGGMSLSNQVVSTISQVISGMITSSNTIGSEISRVISASKAIDGKGLQGAVGRFESIVSERTAGSLKAVVDRLNGINRDLISIAEAPGNLNVKLQKAADNLSMRGSGALTINKPDFTVNINVEVQLNADDFEKTLISRPGGGTKFVVKGQA